MLILFLFMMALLFLTFPIYGGYKTQTGKRVSVCVGLILFYLAGAPTMESYIQHSEDVAIVNHTNVQLDFIKEREKVMHAMLRSRNDMEAFNAGVVLHNLSPFKNTAKQELEQAEKRINRRRYGAFWFVTFLG